MSYNIYFIHGNTSINADRFVNQKFHFKNFLEVSKKFSEFFKIIINFPTFLKFSPKLFYISILLQNSTQILKTYI